MIHARSIIHTYAHIYLYKNDCKHETQKLKERTKNIPYWKDLSSLRKHLELRTEKDISTDKLVELAKIVLKNNIFNFNLKM